nr:probable LRR receptor-like serine/threonine-protein kinase At1g07650 [Populus alba]
MDLTRILFTGFVPPQWNLASYNITPTMPAELGKLVNLTDMRMNDNNFSGKLPAIISNEHSHIQASSLEGTIPSSTASLTRLSDFTRCRNWNVVAIETGTVAGAVYVALLVLELRDLDLQTGLFTLKQMKAATKNFNAANNVGEGVFASVFKGSLSDGTVIAVMLLSSKSKQGNREFVNEIGMISALQHPNPCRVVWMLSWRKPINACVRAYVLQERGSLSEVVDPELGSDYSSEEAMVMLNVALLCTNASPTLRPTRPQVASMLEGQTSVKDLLSDPGFSAINTKYKAIRNHFWQNPSQTYSMSINGSYCSDSTNSYGEPGHLLRAYVLQERGSLSEVVDPELGSEYSSGEAMVILNVALLCTNASPTLRPTRSQVASMLEGQTSVEDFLSDPGFFAINTKYKAIRNHFWQNPSQTYKRIILF